ncbi:hypothetical protein VFPFJ_04492 [Purpureocillium lilacinum]|uniref:Uncharacterized protein n=1 Tax=Purpureocillium lilacinum TaxID=33203 RepID=A0A179HLT7_PURLI|nr:hypothetical protein VFPFJ_04492 [Purpureocillium lilacinum]OAQ83551.1 hypothetical protein VFPBJ_02319 [Purpureocillium lilacinum]OAQ90333.1 hypothetical protein VFPFJ_04492 [Purpureocillium lilacinum]
MSNSRSSEKSPSTPDVSGRRHVQHLGHPPTWPCSTTREQGPGHGLQLWLYNPDRVLRPSLSPISSQGCLRGQARAEARRPRVSPTTPHAASPILFL